MNSPQVISADFVKKAYLFGVNLNDDKGNMLPDAVIDFYINAAQDWLERELQIDLMPKRRVEYHDYYTEDYKHYAFLRLRRYPVLQINSMALQYPLAQNIMTIPKDWFRLEPEVGQVQLTPTVGSISSFVIGFAGSFLPLIYSGGDIGYIPQLFMVDYISGFERNRVPDDVKNLIGMRAAMGPLNILGDLVAGAGIASKSVSIDGLSTSTNTMAGAGQGAYAGRINNFNAQIQSELVRMKQFYKGFQMTVL